MYKININPLIHRGSESIAIVFAENSIINSLVKNIDGIKWSQSNKCWHLPLSKENYLRIATALKNKVSINNSLLKEYLEKRKKLIPDLLPAIQTKPARQIARSPIFKLSKLNKEALEIFIQHLGLKAYSQSTISTYRNEFLQLLQLLKERPVNTLTTDEIKLFMQFSMEKMGIKENTAHSRLNALKYYFEQVLGREKFFYDIPRPKRPLLLPNIMGEKELARLFNALGNLKHKAILFTAYSAGLRVSEVVDLKLSDIDSNRMQIKVENAKGKKDRYVGLSPVLLDILRQYITTINPRPSIFLFEGSQTKTPYNSRTAQRIFQLAKEKAGIKKAVSFHSLRHSFATHLLEKGIDIHYIKEILGHFSIKTTERYLHVKRESLVNIISPLDDLWEKGEIRL